MLREKGGTGTVFPIPSPSGRPFPDDILQSEVRCLSQFFLRTRDADPSADGRSALPASCPQG